MAPQHWGQQTVRCAYGHAGQDVGKSECLLVMRRILVLMSPDAKAGLRPTGLHRKINWRIDRIGERK